MANLIITVVSIALVAVAALMGAYFGGAAFLAGAAQADANRIIKQADQVQAAWSLHATYNSGLFQTVSVSDLATGGKYLSEVPKPPEKISTDAYTLIKLADNSTADGLNGIRLNLLTTDSARKVCNAIAKTAGNGLPNSTPKKLASASDTDRTPSAGRKFDCLFSGTGATPAVGDPMIFVLNVGAPSVAGGGGGGGGPPAAASLAASPGSLSFTTNTNTASGAQVITVSNSGTAGATGVAVSLSSGSTYFAFSTTCGATLAAGSSCTASVNAKSTASAGTYAGNVAIASTDGGGQNVGLSVTVSASGSCTASGAGDSSFDGTYTMSGIINGFPSYTNANNRVIFRRHSGYWYMEDLPGGYNYYFNPDPPQTTCPLGVWSPDSSIGPGPTVN